MVAGKARFPDEVWFHLRSPLQEQPQFDNASARYLTNNAQYDDSYNETRDQEYSEQERTADERPTRGRPLGLVYKEEMEANEDDREFPTLDYDVGVANVLRYI